MEKLAGSLGVSVPVFQFLLAFFGTLPVSLLRRYVEGTQNRHTFAALTGILVSYYAFGVIANLQFAIMIVGTYISMLASRRKCGVFSFCFSFGFLILCHLYYMSGDAWKNGGIDSTGAMMVLTLKVISVAINYQDGLLKDGECREAQKRYRIKELPSIIAYVGYCYCCGTHLAGPVYEIKDYLDWTEDKGLWDPKAERPPPPPFGASFKAFVRSLLCMATYLYLLPRVPLSRLSDHVYQSWGFWKRVGYQLLLAFSARWKYYFIWSLSEASVILSGFGFSGWMNTEKPEAKWDRAENVYIRKVELATSAAELPIAWNIHVSTWLRLYVYERLIRKGKKAGFRETLATQLVSALWHGLYAGYLLFFVSTALLINGSKVIYRWQRALPDNAVLLKQALVVLNGVYTSFALNTACMGFLVLGLQDTLKIYRSVYYTGVLVPLFLFILGYIVQPPAASKPRTKKTN